MVELRKETGVQRSLTERLARSRLQWAEHVERMADDRLPRTVLRERRGRQERRKTIGRGGWKRLPDEAVKKLREAPHP